MSEQYVYFIQADENGPIKIGYTADDPKRRLSQLQTGNASALKLLGAIKGTAAHEKQFHTDLAEWRLQGEWFESHPTVLETIQKALSSHCEPVNCGGPYCSFCGICHHQTDLLIAGRDGVHICTGCCGACARIAAEHLVRTAVAASAPPISIEAMGYGG